MGHRLTLTTMLAALLAATTASFTPVWASSHMDAPLISLDDPANTTDVYAFKSSENNTNYLTTALAVYPFEEPGIGPNNYRFDSRVTYEIHVALGNNTKTGKSDLTYRFTFTSAFKNPATILQSYLGVLQPAKPFPVNQNLRQTYSVTLIDHRTNKEVILGQNIPVPPNNQGRVTPFYNIDNSGDAAAKPGVATNAELDPYTQNGIKTLARGYKSFAGQRDDGFYADIQSIFDLDFSFAKPQSYDSQGGYNVHTIVLNIPMSQLGGAKIAGVYATTSRVINGKKTQIGRQGNPLFAEALVAIADKNKYNAASPVNDAASFTKYAATPELVNVLGTTPPIAGLIKQIYIPDLIKVDLTTPAANLAGTTNFNRLSVFGGDVLKSTFQDPFNNGGFIPGGWPNGRRFGDDVIDIALIALGAAPAAATTDVDKVTSNDITYNMTFPYAATPLNGRVHTHHTPAN